MSIFSIFALTHFQQKRSSIQKRVLGTKGQNTTPKKGTKRAKEIDYSLVSVETLPSYSQRELREIAKYFGIKIPRTCHSQPSIAQHIIGEFSANPAVAQKQVRQDKLVTAEQWQEAKTWIGMLASQDDICRYLGMTVDQVQKACWAEYGINFSEFYENSKTIGRLSLRRLQYQSAHGLKALYNDQRQIVRAEIKPSIQMQIFLGKAELGQVEAKEVKDKNDAAAVTLEQLSEILLEQQGDGVFGGETSLFAVAYDNAKGQNATEQRREGTFKYGEAAKLSTTNLGDTPEL